MAEQQPVVVFVLGGPGSGKGTQCGKIVKEFGFNHLSAGDLLRAEKAKPDSPNGQLIKKCIKEGKMVPGDVTVNLIKTALLAETKSNFFLIDGFPRNEENLSGWKRIVGKDAKVETTLFFECSFEILEKRLIARGKTSGRVDDNIESIKKRFKTFEAQTLPILDIIQKEGISVQKIDSSKSIENVFASVKPLIEKIINENKPSTSAEAKTTKLENEKEETKTEESS